MLVSWNGTIAYEPTLDKALDVVFGTTTAKPPPEQPGGNGNGGGNGGSLSAQVRALVTQLQAAQADADAALRSGDLTAYARAEKRVASLIKQLAKASG